MKPSADLQAFVRGLPKAELHIHIEGSLEPEMVFALARKHGVRLAHSSVEALRSAYDFRDLQSFLDLYYAGAAVLRDAEDFAELAWAYLRKAHAQGVDGSQPGVDYLSVLWNPHQEGSFRRFVFVT